MLGAFEPSRAFGGINTETSRYIVIETVNAQSIVRIGESVDRPKTWISKALALSVDQFTYPLVNRLMVRMVPAKSQSIDHFILFG